MKKKLLYVAILAASISVAQPVLQQANLAPIGLTCDMSYGGPSSPGSGGSNQTWNFSSASVAPAGTVAVVNPSSTNCGGSFTSSNYSWIFPGPNYNYYNLSTADMQMYGTNIPTSCSGGYTYTDPYQILKFPLHYLDTWSDTYVNNSGSGSGTFSCDGYGTLITPTATYNNVLRLVIQEGTTYTYQWFSTGSPSMLLMLINSNSTIIMSNIAVGVAENSHSNEINIGPNPSNGLFTINASEPFDHASASVCDAMGRSVMKVELNGTQPSIDCSNLARGMYWINITESGKQIAAKKIIIE